MATWNDLTTWDAFETWDITAAAPTDGVTSRPYSGVTAYASDVTPRPYTTTTPRP